MKPDTIVDAYICTSCNDDDEAKKPWLLQHTAPPEGPHHVQHILVLATDPSVSSLELTTEDRLDRLEKKFEEQRDRFEKHEKVMQERMEEVSRLLHQLLAHHEQSTSG